MSRDENVIKRENKNEKNPKHTRKRNAKILFSKTQTNRKMLIERMSRNRKMNNKTMCKETSKAFYVVLSLVLLQL